VVGNEAVFENNCHLCITRTNEKFRYIDVATTMKQKIIASFYKIDP